MLYKITTGNSYLLPLGLMIFLIQELKLQARNYIVVASLQIVKEAYLLLTSSNCVFLLIPVCLFMCTESILVCTTCHVGFPGNFVV